MEHMEKDFVLNVIHGIQIEREFKMTEESRFGLFYRLYAYFMHGHGAWMGFLTSIGTFLMVLFGFAFGYFLLVGEWLANPVIYLMVAFPAYMILAIVGRWSYYKGAFAARAKIEWRQNPEYMEMKADLKEIKEMVKELDEFIKRNIQTK